MIIVIIGQSGSGKTSFAKKNFLNGHLEIIEDAVPYTTNGDFCAIGKYGISIRTEGTDTLSYNSGDKIRALIKKLNDEGKNILIEGDRINNLKTFEFLETLDAEIKLYLLVCSLETSRSRLKSAGSKISLKFIKATKTRSRNIFLKFYKKFDGKVIIND